MGEPSVVMSNFESRHNYFGWPTVTRLQNGKIAVVASGYRLAHICPFGKTVISYSENEGKTYTRPAPVIDTVLDDRDGGIATFGKSGVIITSFNNTLEFQKKYAKAPESSMSKYRTAYLNAVTECEEEHSLGATFKISHDFGVTFSELYKSPITSPHGPLELSDGSILWVGRTFSSNDAAMPDDGIKAYKLNPDNGKTEYLGEIENPPEAINGVLMCEPHTIELSDGTLICHIRASRYSDKPVFTLYQSESCDKGKTWSLPHKILENDEGGAPSHMLIHSTGAIICTYGYRRFPFGIKAMVSVDGGKSWENIGDIYVNEADGDLGYPSTVELADKSLLTVFYAHRTKNEPAIILQQKWSLSK